MNYLSLAVGLFQHMSTRKDWGRQKYCIVRENLLQGLTSTAELYTCPVCRILLWYRLVDFARLLHVKCRNTFVFGGKKMNIGLSIEHLHGKKTGVGQYGFNIALNLAKIDNINSYFLFSPAPLDKGDVDRLSEYPNIKVLDRNVLEKYIPKDVILIPFWLHLYLPYLCKRTGVDIYFNTGSIWPLFPFRFAYTSGGCQSEGQV